MAYRPYPLGIKSMTEEGWEGGGLCSPKLNPYNEMKSACYDYDVYDCSPGPQDRVPPGPQNKWFDDIWNRDFPLLKELGVNTIRIYNFNPITLEISPKLVEEGWNGVVAPYGKNHKRFMELASSYDFKVIVPLLSDYNSFVNDSSEILKRNIENIVREIGNYSSLLMFEIGNEFPLQSEEDFEKMNELIQYTNDRMLAFYDRFIPIMHCTNDDPSKFVNIIESLIIDVFCTNSGYDDINMLFEGIEEANYDGWKTILKNYKMPIYIGEFGFKGMSNSLLSENPSLFNEKWDKIVSHIDDGCVGGSYFEYNDEPYTQDNPDMRTLGAVYFQSSMEGIRLSTDKDAFFVDDALKKSIIFDSIKEGSWNDKPINFNTDIFEYIQRERKNITLYGGRKEPESSSISIKTDLIYMVWLMMFILIVM